MYKTLFISDDPSLQSDENMHCISFTQYLEDYPKIGENKIRIINLCDTSRYLSHGYYCSLLAEARKHPVLPNVKVINALRESHAQCISFSSIPVKSVHFEQATPKEFVICMGQTDDVAHKKLAEWIYQQFSAPLLIVNLDEQSLTINRCSLSQLSDSQRQYCLKVLHTFAEKAWRTKRDKKKYRWDLAILTNPNETGATEQ